MGLQQRRQLFRCGVIGQDQLDTIEERDKRVTTAWIELNVLNEDTVQR